MAADPGGQQVGQISIRVVPNTARFARELKAQLEKLERTLKVQLPVEVDTDGVTEKVKQTVERASNQTVKLGTDVDASGVEARTKAIAKQASDEVIKLKAELESSGITRAVRRIRNIAQKATGAIQLTASLNMAASMAKIWAQMKIIQRSVRGYNIRIPVDWVGLAKLLGIAGAVSGAFLGIQNAVLALGGALKATAGIALTLPAIMVAAGTGIATLVVGLQGFFGALKNSGDVAAFEESLKKLAPSAQESARALAAFREPLKEIQQATQQALFEGMASSFSKLGVLLPPVRAGMVGVATGLRDMARGWVDMATSSQSVADLNSIMQGTAGAFQNASPAAAAFGQALRDIAAVGASFLPRMGTAVANVANKFRDFISEARASGDLGRWIQNGIDSFREFGKVLANVWAIFANVANAMRGGQSFLQMLSSITGKMREFTASAKGQAAFASLAAVMREVASAAGDVLIELLNQLADVLKDATPFLVEFAKQLGGALVAALKIVGPMLQSLARFLSENKAIMAPLLVALTGVVTAFKVLSTVANGINAVGNAFTAMRAATELMNKGATKSVELFGKMKTSLISTGKTILETARHYTTLAFKAIWSATVTAAKWIGTAIRVSAVWIANMVRMVVVTIANWTRMAISATINATMIAAAWLANAARITAVWIANTVRMAAVAIANWVRMAISATVNATVIAATWIAQGAAMAAAWIANIARIVAFTIANWVRMAAVALAQAARMAASWFIAMGPVGWVIGIVVALVALIIANWDKVVAFTRNAWNWVSNAVRNGANAAKNAAVNIFNSVVSFMGSIPGRIMGALGNLGSLLVGAGRSLINGFVNGIKAAFNSAISAVRSGITAIRNLFPFSPAKDGPFSGKGYTLYSGRALMEDWAKGIEQKAPQALRTMRNAMDGANEAVSADWNGHMTADGFGLSTAVRDGVLTAFSGSRLQVDGSGVAKLVNTVNAKNARR